MNALSRSISGLILAGVALASGLVMSPAAHAQQASQSKPITAQVRVSKGGMFTTVKGYVIDSSCTFRNDLKKPVSVECAQACAKAGSTLVIQTEDGSIYWPISPDMPATSQNDKLMSYAGKMVTVTGTPYSKGGSKAIVIEKIEAVEASK